MGVVHVAGPVVAGSVQFCSRCDAVLLDFEGVAFSVPVDQGPWSPPFWAEGGLILRDGAMSCVVLELEADDVECPV
jgi:hypothetical protein